MLRSNKIVKILSVDGGGIKGIIPIVILEFIKSELSKKGVKSPLYNVFDIIAGTSTGGIIALALASPMANRAKPMSLNELLGLYENKSSYIFHSDHSALFNAFLALFKPPYNPSRIESELLKIFGDETLKDVLTDIYVTSLNAVTYGTKSFTKVPYSDIESENYYIRDVARATSAEPALFPPANISPINKSISYCLIDGGFYALNPSLNAYMYAKAKFPNADKYIVLSLGTGSFTNEFTCKEMSQWGLGSWVAPWKHVQLIQCCLQGQINNTNELLRDVDDVRFFRLDPIIDIDDNSAADVSKTNIIKLEKIATDYVKREMTKIHKLVNLLID